MTSQRSVGRFREHEGEVEAEDDGSRDRLRGKSDITASMTENERMEDHDDPISS